MCVSRAWKFRLYSSTCLGQGAPAAKRWRTSDAYGFVPARLWTGIFLGGLLGLLALVAGGVGWLLAMHLGFSKHGQGMSFRSSKSTSSIMGDVGLKISTAALASSLVVMLVANAAPTAAGWFWAFETSWRKPMEWYITLALRGLTPPLVKKLLFLAIICCKAIFFSLTTQVLSDVTVWPGLCVCENHVKSEIRSCVQQFIHQSSLDCGLFSETVFSTVQPVPHNSRTLRQIPQSLTSLVLAVSLWDMRIYPPLKGCRLNVLHFQRNPRTPTTLPAFR